jgi:hypothetical protein
LGEHLMLHPNALAFYIDEAGDEPAHIFAFGALLLSLSTILLSRRSGTL